MKKLAVKRTKSLGLIRLAELTNNLPRMSGMVDYVTDGVIHFETVSGTIKAEIIWKNDNITIIKIDCSEGAESQLHTHKETETLHVFEGKAEITINHQVITLCQYDSITIPSHVPHIFRCLQPSMVMAILMPADKELQCQ